MTIRSALRDWWLHEARVHMAPVEMADSLIAALHAAGYVIIKDRADPEGGIPGRS